MTDKENNKFEGLHDIDLNQVNGGGALEDMQYMQGFLQYLEAGDKDGARDYFARGRIAGVIDDEDAKNYYGLYLQYTGEEMPELVW